MNPSSINEQPVALITGGARRIGAVIATVLHQAGYRLIIHYNQSAEAASALIDSFNQQRRDSAAGLSADFNDCSTFNTCISSALQVWQRLDVLINNASSFYPTPVGATMEDQWQDFLF